MAPSYDVSTTTSRRSTSPITSCSAGEVTFVHTMLAPRAPETDEQRAMLDKTWDLIDGRDDAVDRTIAESPRE